MAYTYSDYITLDGRPRLVRLRLFIQELRDAITHGVSSDGQSINSSDIASQLPDLLREEVALANAYGGVNRSPISLIRIARA